MLWLAVPVSRQPAFVCPRGAIACFLLLDGKGNGWGSVEGLRRGAFLLLIALALCVVDLFHQCAAEEGSELGGVQGKITG